ncbi:VCBS repeat-containing protein [Streptomyces bambusae]|uniref:FG-GAP repeat domain-containing protein n=1 Tax=Streptomyces bambusae TaxID=1550616 RepID=UPI001CFD1245|nr:VCBS repeat-containing protein [Streptomyces bambusae]MCB5164383.1 VCBS repeat-containing protein [Streptomyces bambusae]
MRTRARTHHRLALFVTTAALAVSGAALAPPAAAVTAGAPAAAEVPIVVTGSQVPAVADARGNYPAPGWKPVWTVNQPVTWTLTFTDLMGKHFHTITETTAQQEIKPYWHGLDGYFYAANGPMGWELKATAVGSPTAVVLDRGTVTVIGGKAVRRDVGGPTGTPDGIADLMSTTASGTLRTAYGNRSTGNFSGSATSTGWPKGFRPIPTGLMDENRCNDTLVRLATGEMRVYTPGCGAPLTPASPYKVLGKGWNAYDIITSVGNVSTGVNLSGEADLIARDPKTGNLYLYTSFGYSIFYPRELLGTGYNQYKKIVGAGDLNGDGHGDLLLQDKSNKLWRMNGLGKKKFAKRVLLAENWGASFNAVVGIRDLTGDGHADLLARDTAGNIWRWKGTGKGTFGGRTRLATGWQVYDGIH